MNTLGRMKSVRPVQYFFKVSAYTFFLLLVQAIWVARLPYPALRADLLLPMMFGIAVEWSPPLCIAWALSWGFVMDALSGEFWGFHVGSYVAAICLVNITVERFEFQNPLYQMAFVGLCALGQSVALGVYLIFSPSGAVSVASVWMSLAIRAIFIAVLAPFLIYPIWNSRRGGR